jgi:hypothetical protein
MKAITFNAPTIRSKSIIRVRGNDSSGKIIMLGLSPSSWKERIALQIWNHASSSCDGCILGETDWAGHARL